MKKIGLIGGISWVSTMDYYKFLNEGINEKLGGLNFAECIIYSLNFGDVQEKTWEHSFELFLNACESLKRSGVDAIVLCANTAHLFADELATKIALPIIHIGTETAKEIKQQGINKVGLLGTKFTMEMDFYRNKLVQNGLEVLVPNLQETRDYIQLTLKEELGRGIINPITKQNYITIANDLIAMGAEAIILGCTEIPMILSQQDFVVPVFDTTKIHVQAIIEYALS
ncbi:MULTISPECIES: amino acid racemase [unclassified Arcicella]|uniref:aspartate/glutamate racemase family protein n=1 Tax=unclassified Arcicella TaxID=2644986 RepID=UPI0028670C13|nr:MULTISPECIES: amino acid racemase [unclassified Arcicella]MDR6560201.1 aspartate racemase [Arcicella sp. BE51]MDR6810192.1 aspartate racemase [Arcicella sp. BE140]MDR6821542.1 aspartate racemase [Arcicella sp. BE139]